MLGKKALLLKRGVKTIRKQMGKKKPRAKVMKVGRPPTPEAVDTKCDTAYSGSQSLRRSLQYTHCPHHVQGG